MNQHELRMYLKRKAAAAVECGEGGSADNAGVGNAGGGNAGGSNAGGGNAGVGNAGGGSAGVGSAGVGSAGEGNAGVGSAGEGNAGVGSAGEGTAGVGSAGEGTAGGGNAGEGNAGDSESSDESWWINVGVNRGDRSVTNNDGEDDDDDDESGVRASRVFTPPASDSEDNNNEPPGAPLRAVRRARAMPGAVDRVSRFTVEAAAGGRDEDDEPVEPRMTRARMRRGGRAAGGDGGAAGAVGGGAEYMTSATESVSASDADNDEEQAAAAPRKKKINRLAGVRAVMMREPFHESVRLQFEGELEPSSSFFHMGGAGTGPLTQSEQLDRWGKANVAQPKMEIYTDLPDPTAVGVDKGVGNYIVVCQDTQEFSAEVKRLLRTSPEFFPPTGMKKLDPAELFARKSTDIWELATNYTVTMQKPEHFDELKTLVHKHGRNSAPAGMRQKTLGFRAYEIALAQSRKEAIGVPGAFYHAVGEASFTLIAGGAKFVEFAEPGTVESRQLMEAMRGPYRQVVLYFMRGRPHDKSFVVMRPRRFHQKVKVSLSFAMHSDPERRVVFYIVKPVDMLEFFPAPVACGSDAADRVLLMQRGAFAWPDPKNAGRQAEYDRRPC